MTVAELQARIGAKELREWAAYYELEPFGQWRDNFHMAVMTADLVNVSGRLKSPKKYMDYMFMTSEERRDMRTQETLQHMDALAKRNPDAG